MVRSAEASIALRSTDLHEGDRLGDALFELRDRRLVVLEFRRLDAGEPRRAVLGQIAGDLDLPGQREHVGREPRSEQIADVEFLRGGVRLGLVEQPRQAR